MAVLEMGGREGGAGNVISFFDITVGWGEPIIPVSAGKVHKGSIIPVSAGRNPYQGADAALTLS